MSHNVSANLPNFIVSDIKITLYIQSVSEGILNILGSDNNDNFD